MRRLQFPRDVRHYVVVCAVLVLTLPSPSFSAKHKNGTTSSDGWRTVHASLKGSIAASFSKELPDPKHKAAAAVYARLFMWDLDLRRDLDPGDRLAMVFNQKANGEPIIGAARYASSRDRRTFEAFRFQLPDDPYPTYLTGDGVEVPRRLRDGPIERYEQITALLKDRPTHQGIDFKAPIGTPVFASRAGTVTRVNWRQALNGKCLELRFDDGILAKYLHLSSVKVNPGSSVRKGQVVALTGNTGRSTAPHLHYQLNRGGVVVDPIRYHGTIARHVPEAARPAFRKAVARFKALLDEPAVVPAKRASQ